MELTNTIRRVEKNEVQDLVQISIQTFEETYKHLNDPADYNAFVTASFNAAQLSLELETKGSHFYFLEQRTENGNLILGFIKLNIHRHPSDAHAAHFDQPLLSDDPRDWLEVERIYINKQGQGKQLGAQLIQFAFQKARAEQCKFVWLGVWDINDAAIAFYKKLGFEQFGSHIFVVGTDAQTDLLFMVSVDN